MVGEGRCTLEGRLPRSPEVLLCSDLSFPAPRDSSVTLLVRAPELDPGAGGSKGVVVACGTMRPSAHPLKPGGSFTTVLPSQALFLEGREQRPELFAALPSPASEATAGHAARSIHPYGAQDMGKQEPPLVPGANSAPILGFA